MKNTGKEPEIVNSDIGYMITNISYGIRQYFDRLFAECGITYPQSRVLSRLFSALDGDPGESVNQRDLERALGIKASSVSSLVKNLEEKGFVRCERLPEDTRNKRVLLTEKGMEIRTKLIEVRARAEQEMAAGLNEGQIAGLRESLQVIMKNLSDK